MANAKEAKRRLRVAALADIHYGKASEGALADLFAQINQAADVVLFAGDMTDYGLTEEAQILAKDLKANFRIPMLGVLGNHDFESGKQNEISNVFAEAGVVMLDGETCEVQGVGFAGVKGFGGGFDKFMLAPWGEDLVKQFVNEAVNEALKLEAALSKLTTDQCIALLHYAPIKATVEGESPEIYPFAGCSRLEEPLNRRGVFAAFHGHLHHGSPEGRTVRNIPVYNVSLPLLRRVYPDRPPYCLLEVPYNSNPDE